MMNIMIKLLNITACSPKKAFECDQQERGKNRNHNVANCMLHKTNPAAMWWILPEYGWLQKPDGAPNMKQAQQLGHLEQGLLASAPPEYIADRYEYPAWYCFWKLTTWKSWGHFSLQKWCRSKHWKSGSLHNNLYLRLLQVYEITT